MSQSIDVSKQEQERLAKEAAAKAAAEQAIKDEEARQKAEVESKFQEYAMREAAIQQEIQNLPKESYQSGVEIRKDKIGKMVPVSPGASKGRLVFEDQVFPIYDTRYTPESETKLKDLQTELATLQSTHQASLADPYYQQLSEQQSTQANRAQAEAKLEQLKKQKAYIESFPTPTPQGAHISSTQRRQIAEATAKRSHEISQLESQIKQTEAYLQSPSVVGLSLKTEQFEGIRYSSPSGAIGYNPMTGRVEVGSGDLRGTVVSQSAAEDKMELERIKKEAGYTGKATIDPRIGVFKTVDDGIMTPGFKAQPHVDILREFGQPIVKPQRERKSILTDQPDSKYANPDFVSREKQALLDQKKQVEPGKNYFINLEESPQLYTLEFESGTKLEGLTSAQVAEYQKTFELGRKLYEFKEKQYYSELGKYAKDLKAQGVKEVPVLTQGKTVFVPVQNLVSEMKKISAKDPQARITQFVSLSESLDVRESPIMQTQVEQSMTGKKTFTVATPPPTPPKYELLSFIPLSVTDKPGELKGIGTFKEQGQGLVTISTPEQVEQYRTTEAREEFNRLLKQVEAETLKAGESGDILGQITGEVRKNLYATVAGIQNLYREYLIEPVEEFRYQQSSVPFTPLYTPKDLTGIGVGGVIASAAKLAPLTPLGPILKPQATLKPKNATEVIVEAGTEAAQTFETEVVQKGQSYIETFGPGTVIGAIVGGVLPDGRLAPLRVVRVAPIVEGVPKVVATAVKLGYGTGVSRYQIGRITETGKFFAGIPEPSAIPGISKVGFTGPAPRGGYAITEDVSGYMYRPKTLEYLVQKQVLKPEEATLITATERRLKLTAKYPDIILRKDLPAQPVRSLEAGAAETGTFFKGTEKQKLGLYGSVTEQFYMESKYLEQSRDVDIHITGRGAGEKATKIATKIAEEMQTKTRPERQFFVKTKIDDEIDITTGKPTGKKEVDRAIISVTTEARKITSDLDEMVGIEQTKKIGKSPLDELYKTGGIVDESVVLYHGTTKEGAESILSGKIQENLYATPTYKEAAEYGDVVLAIKLKPGTKFVASEFVEKGTVRLGKVERLGGSIREAEISSPKLIERVTVWRGKTDQVRTVIKGEEGREKVSEFIVKSPQTATKEGFEYTKMSEVFGMKVPDKMVKAKTVIPDAYEGTQKITIFRRQELRRSSAMLELQQEGKGGIVRPDPGREKEFTKVVGQTMTRAKQAERMGRPKEAKELREYAEQVKAFAKARGLWREGLKVDEISDEGGIIIPESNLSKAAREISEKAPKPTITPKEDQEVSPTPPQTSRVSAVSKSFDSDVSRSAVSSAISRLESKSAISRITPTESKIRVQSRVDSKASQSKIRGESRGRSNLSRLDGSHITPSRAGPSQVQSRAKPSRFGQSRAGPSVAALTGASTIPASRSAIQPSRVTLQRVTPGIDIIKPTVKVPIIPFDKLKQKTDKERERAEKERADFIGQAKVSEIVGFGRRGDITYGRVLTAKLAGRDVRESGKRSGSFVRSRSVSLLDRTKPSIIKKDKKQREFKL